MQGSQTGTRDFTHLKELIEEIRVGMLTTTDTDERGRPAEEIYRSPECQHGESGDNGLQG